MTGSEKPCAKCAGLRERLQELHRSLLQQDKKAFEQLVTLLRPRLVTTLARRHGWKVDHQLIEEAVDVALIEYRDGAPRFDPSREVPLDSFLTKAAQRNVLDSLRRDTRRKEREKRAIEQKENFSVDIAGSAANSIEDAAAREYLAESLVALLQNPVDQQILRLRMRGVRGMRLYAVAMGISQLPLDEQKRQVKRAKDRIIKDLQRRT